MVEVFFLCLGWIGFGNDFSCGLDFDGVVVILVILLDKDDRLDIWSYGMMDDLWEGWK